MVVASTVSEAVAWHGVTSNGRRRGTDGGAAEAARDELEREERRRASHALTNDAPCKE